MLDWWDHGDVVWAQELLVAVGDVDRRVLRIRVDGEVDKLGLATCGQTHSSERTRLGCHTNFFFGFGNDVGTLDDKALDDEWCDGKGTTLTWSNDIKNRMRMRVGMTLTFTQTQLDLDPQSAQSCTRESVLRAPGSVFCAHTPSY